MTHLQARALTILVLVAGGFMTLVTVYQGSGACGGADYCAEGGAPQVWVGRVFTRDGAPAAYATVSYSFVYQSPPVVTLTTDREGRYACAGRATIRVHLYRW